ncbi:hypothetical protein SLEP1_g10912 [Rubroshorea leprosula]|uniref:Uncharacterized protein n=1 Tax=Rubroshorea leprosula TaxID=152421 RepID=A0AAV5IJM0_9ROSI|nr:hypothetical protein SLEP1_g10912 [Rubroshorea leprosula]
MALRKANTSELADSAISSSIVLPVVRLSHHTTRFLPIVSIQMLSVLILLEQPWQEQSWRGC